MKRLLLIYKESFSNLQRNTWILALAMFINRSGAKMNIATLLKNQRSLGELGMTNLIGLERAEGKIYLQIENTRFRLFDYTNFVS